MTYSGQQIILSAIIRTLRGYLEQRLTHLMTLCDNIVRSILLPKSFITASARDAHSLSYFRRVIVSNKLGHRHVDKLSYLIYGLGMHIHKHVTLCATSFFHLTH